MSCYQRLYLEVENVIPAWERITNAISAIQQQGTYTEEIGQGGIIKRLHLKEAAIVENKEKKDEQTDNSKL